MEAVIMAKPTTNDLFLLQCEKIVNKTWSITATHYDAIKRIVEKGSPSNDSEEAIMMIAANATLQKMTLDRAMDKDLFGLEMSSCGKYIKNNCPCDREVCLMK